MSFWEPLRKKSSLLALLGVAGSNDDVIDALIVMKDLYDGY
jgi:hypothetical protein